MCKGMCQSLYNSTLSSVPGLPEHGMLCVLGWGVCGRQQERQLILRSVDGRKARDRLFCPNSVLIPEQCLTISSLSSPSIIYWLSTVCWLSNLLISYGHILRCSPSKWLLPFLEQSYSNSSLRGWVGKTGREKWFWSSVSFTDGRRDGMMGMSFEAMAVLEGACLGKWDASHTDEEEDPQTANEQQIQSWKPRAEKVSLLTQLIQYSSKLDHWRDGAIAQGIVCHRYHPSKNVRGFAL